MELDAGGGDAFLLAGQQGQRAGQHPGRTRRAGRTTTAAAKTEIPMDWCIPAFGRNRPRLTSLEPAGISSPAARRRTWPGHDGHAPTTA